MAEREELPAPPPGLGAASLLHRNDDDRWPAFRGRDLVSHAPGIPLTDLTQDGATVRWVVGLQMPRIPSDPQGPVLVTLTAGGNDLLQMLEAPPATIGGPFAREAPSDVDDLADALTRVVERLRAELEASTVVVGTVYDPSDGTGDLPGADVPEGALEVLDAFNERVRALGHLEGVRVADVHDHFLGHGLAEPDEAARWYWRHSVIEPSARGASEVRRLFLEAVGL